MTKSQTRRRKDGRYVNVCVQKEIADGLDEFCEKTGLSKVSAVEHALTNYLAYYQKTGKIE